ncbi:MAG: hypothetical protein ABGX07_14495 [Pirellulaceae bacterium]
MDEFLNHSFLAGDVVTWSVCEMLSNDEGLCSIPVIMLTGRTDEDTVRRCHSMCAYYVLKSTDIWERVGPFIREILKVEPSDTTGDSSTGELGGEISREVAFAQLSDETCEPSAH